MAGFDPLDYIQTTPQLQGTVQGFDNKGQLRELPRAHVKPLYGAEAMHTVLDRKPAVLFRFFGPRSEAYCICDAYGHPLFEKRHIDEQTFYIDHTRTVPQADLVSRVQRAIRVAKKNNTLR